MIVEQGRPTWYNQDWMDCMVCQSWVASALEMHQVSYLGVQKRDSLGRTCWLYIWAVLLIGQTFQNGQMLCGFSWVFSWHCAVCQRHWEFCSLLCWVALLVGLYHLSLFLGHIRASATVGVCMRPTPRDWGDGHWSSGWSMLLLCFWCDLDVLYFLLLVHCRFLESFLIPLPPPALLGFLCCWGLW